MKMDLLTKIALAFALSVGIPCVLFFAAHVKRAPLNGFHRLFSGQRVAKLVASVNLGFDSYYIAGNAKRHLYLGNVVAPRHMLIVEGQTLDTVGVKLALVNPDHLQFWSVTVKVDSPSFYMVDGSVPAIFKGMLDTREAYLIDRKTFFLDFEPMCASTYAIRGLSLSKEGRLGRLSGEPPCAEFPCGLLERQVDGIFCTDGMMHYSDGERKLVYIYFYRNQYLVMDDSFNLLVRANTIDTTSVAKIEVSSMSSGDSRSLSAPPLVVNKQSCVYRRWLFVNSSLVADNENADDFSENSVIDVYDLDQGHYLYSFYVPNFHRERLRYFQVFHNKLVALFSRHLVSFDLTFLELDADLGIVRKDLRVSQD